MKLLALLILFLVIPVDVVAPLPEPTLPIAKDIEYETRVSIKHRITTSARRNNMDVETSLRIAACESGFDPSAVNPNSSASGLYQFTDSTWEWIGSPGDRINAQDSIDAFMEWWPKYPHWWICK